MRDATLVEGEAAGYADGHDDSADLGLLKGKAEPLLPFDIELDGIANFGFTRDRIRSCRRESLRRHLRAEANRNKHWFRVRPKGPAIPPARDAESHADYCNRTPARVSSSSSARGVICLCRQVHVRIGCAHCDVSLIQPTRRIACGADVHLTAVCCAVRFASGWRRRTFMLAWYGNLLPATRGRENK